MTTNYHFRPRAPQKRESRHLSTPLHPTPPLAVWIFLGRLPLESDATTPEFFPPRGENLSLSPHPSISSPFHRRSLCRVRPATTFCRRFFASLLSLRMVGTATSLSTPVATPGAPCSGFQGFQLLGSPSFDGANIVIQDESWSGREEISWERRREGEEDLGALLSMGWRSERLVGDRWMYLETLLFLLPFFLSLLFLPWEIFMQTRDEISVGNISQKEYFSDDIRWYFSILRRKEKRLFYSSNFVFPRFIESNILYYTETFKFSFRFFFAVPIPRAEVQSRFPAESTEIIKSISGSKRANWKNGFTGGWLSFFLLFLSFLSSFPSPPLSLFLIFRGKSRRYRANFYSASVKPASITAN